MWLFTRGNFLSIVQDLDNRNNLLVRARYDGDIEELFPSAMVRKTPKADYLYRASIDRTEVMEVVAEQVAEIDYANFKSANPKHRQHDLMKIWNVMYDAQDAHS